MRFSRAFRVGEDVCVEQPTERHNLAQNKSCNGLDSRQLIAGRDWFTLIDEISREMVFPSLPITAFILFDR